MKIFKQKNAAENSIAATINLIRALKVNVTETSIFSSFKKQQNTNSLAAIINSLDQWGISSIGVQAELDQLKTEVTYPCIGHLNNNNGTFIIITEVVDDRITYIDCEKGVITEVLEFFSAKWSGVLLIPEVNPNAGELEFSEKQKSENWNKQKYPTIIGLSVSFLLLIILETFLKGTTPIVWYLLVFNTLCGVLISIALIQTKYTAGASMFCRSDAKVDCNQVINSNGAKIFSWFDLTDACIIYFAGNLLSLFFCSLASRETELIEIRTIVSFLSIPFILFSLTYQKMVIKKWCTLCLMIVLVLLVDLGVEAYFKSSGFQNKVLLLDVFIYLAGFALISAIWFGMKSMFLIVNKLKEVELTFDSIIRSPNFITLLIEQFPKIETMSSPYFIEIGNPEGGLKLHVFISPMCPSCARIYPLISKLISDDRISLKLLICPNRNSDDKVFEFTRRTISFYKLMEIEKVKNGLSSWFELYQNEKSYKWFQDNMPIEDNEVRYNEIIDNNIEILNKLGIDLVPTFVINDSIFPSEYGIEILEASIRHKLHQMN